MDLTLKRNSSGNYNVIFPNSTKFIKYISTVRDSSDVYFNLCSGKWEVLSTHLDRFLRDHSKMSIYIDVGIEEHEEDYQYIGQYLKLSPYDYQKEAIKFCVDNKNVLLVYPCGSGKTVIGIGTYLELLNSNDNFGKGLIIVKSSLKYQWYDEVKKFSDLKPIILRTASSISPGLGSKINKAKKELRQNINDKEKAKELRKQIKEDKNNFIGRFNEQFEEDYDLIIINYEALRDDLIRNTLLDIHFDFIFADEVHMIASHTAKRTKCLQQFDAKVKVGATATPITKNPENLFSIFKFLKPDLFESFSSFSNKFMNYNQFGHLEGGKNYSDLSEAIEPYTIVKSDEDIAKQLPSLRVVQRYITMNPKQIAMNERLESDREDLKDQQLKLKGKRNRIITEDGEEESQDLKELDNKILALQTFMQELADDPRLLSMSDSSYSKTYAFKCSNNPKLDTLVDIVDEIIDSGEKVAIFSRIVRMQDLLTEAIHDRIDDKIKIAYLNGKMSSKDRNIEVYQKFRDDDEYKILLVSDAGCEGINLSACKYLIEYDIAESYAKQKQRHGRIRRADSTHDNVIVYQLICRGSWDETQLKIVEKKEGFDTDIIQSLKK